MKTLKLLLLFILFSTQTYAQCWTQIAAGEYHTLAIKSDGTLWAWGRNDKGQLGDGSLIDKNTPIQIGIDSNWMSIDANGDNSTALKIDGSLWGWGDNYWGQNGNGNFGIGAMDPIPTRIGSDNDWTKFSSPNYAIKSNGTLWGWGYILDTGIGNDDNAPHYTPVQIGISSNWIDISTSFRARLAVKSDMTVWGWGYNYLGALAIGEVNHGETQTIITSPTQAGNGSSDWSKVETGGCCHSKMIKIDGSLWGMGTGGLGNIGDGTNLSIVNIPTRVGTDNDWKIVATNYHTCAIKNNGTIWSWGANWQGQLGDGSNTEKNVPNQIGIGINWQLVKVGTLHTVALSNNNTLYAWGDNRYGQLGDGTFINKNTITQIGNSCLLNTSGFNAIKTLHVFPNPTTSKLILNYYSSENTTSLMNVSNILGQIIYQKNQLTILGENTETIDFNLFKPGVYFVSIMIDGKEETVQVIKQ